MVDRSHIEDALRVEWDEAFLDLALRHLDGQLAPAETDQLNALLLHDDARRQTLVVLATATRLLTATLQPQHAARRFIRRPASRRPGLRRLVRYAAAAVIVLAFTGAISALIALSASHADRSASRTPVATLVDAHHAEWGDSDVPTAVGSQLPGGTLRLKSGTAEIEFFSGARVTLTGPAEFGLNSEMRGFLKSGTLLAYCPPSAHGFTVGAPGCAVVDLGTRFALRVAGGVNEVQVIAGQVRLQTPSHGRVAGQERLLTRRHAVRVLSGDSNIQPIAFDTTLPGARDAEDAAPLPEPIHHWTFDETADFFRDVAGGADLKIDPRVRVDLPGPVGHAANLHRVGLTSVKPLTPSGDGFTITAWVKPGPDADNRECRVFTARFGGSRFIGLSLFDEKPGRHAAVFFSGDGAAKRSAVLSADGSCPVGEWVYLAAVSPGLGSGQPMKIYVNGVLQPLRPLFDRAGRPALPGWPGTAYANVGETGSQKAGDLGIDDLRLYRGQLSAAQINQVMRDRSSK